MIYTLTLNPAMDKTVVIENFSPGGVNRIQSLRVDVGGKGINVSKCLKSLGCESTAAAFWGGTVGQRGIDFLRENGIGSLAVTVSEDTRTNLKIIDPVRHENTDISLIHCRHRHGRLLTAVLYVHKERRGEAGSSYESRVSVEHIYGGESVHRKRP